MPIYFNPVDVELFLHFCFLKVRGRNTVLSHALPPHPPTLQNLDLTLVDREIRRINSPKQTQFENMNLDLSFQQLSNQWLLNTAFDLTKHQAPK